MPKILQMNLSKDSITQIMSSQDISTEDKQKFQDVIKQSSESEKQDELFKSIAQLPESILNIILPDSTYEGKEISSKDKIELLTLISQMQDGEKNTNNDCLLFSSRIKVNEDGTEEIIEIENEEEKKIAFELFSTAFKNLKI